MRQDVPVRSFTHAFKAMIGIAAVMVVLVVVGCGGGSGGGPSTAHDKLASLCERATDRDSTYCGCVADTVIKAGYDTDAEIGQIEALSEQASKAGNLSGLPAPIVSALNSCDAPTS